IFVKSSRRLSLVSVSEPLSRRGKRARREGKEMMKPEHSKKKNTSKRKGKTTTVGVLLYKFKYMYKSTKLNV
ncbi:hypothetical protein M5D96_012858, partial [Drosophila gunungcola]